MVAAAFSAETSCEQITVTPKIEQKVQPKKKPLPSLEEIKQAIPPQCFEKNWKTSLSYLALDYVIIAGLYLLLPTIEHYGGWMGLLSWYYVTGMFLSSLFCIGHDCGHGTFSDYEWLNDLCGHLAHAPIMAPFWPWQKSHRQHHQYTGHLEKDRGHPWVTKEDYVEKDWISKHFCKLPISGMLRWNPIYTFVGLPDGSHFYPFSPLFTNNTDRIKCVVSGAAVAVCSYVAFSLCNYSIYNFIKYYYVPLLFQGLWMVMITYLQHQDEEIEVYETSEWNYVRGQSQTIDRYYGLGIDSALHHISDGHVAHHFFFTKIPHYHLLEATEAIRSVLRDYPGAYKRRDCFYTLFEFLRLNVKLDYLLGKGTGLLKYRVSRDYKNKAQ